MHRHQSRRGLGPRGRRYGQLAYRFRNSTSDDSQLAYAVAEGRTLLTHDLDFIAESAQLLAAGNHHAGVLIAPDRGDLKLLLRAILYSLQQWEPEDVKDQVWWLLPPPDRRAK